MEGLLTFITVKFCSLILIPCQTGVVTKRFRLLVLKLPIRYLSDMWPSLHLMIIGVIIQPTPHTLLFVPCCIANRLTTMNQQNTQACS